MAPGHDVVVVGRPPRRRPARAVLASPSLRLAGLPAASPSVSLAFVSPRRRRPSSCQAPAGAWHVAPPSRCPPRPPYSPSRVGLYPRAGAASDPDRGSPARLPPPLSSSARSSVYDMCTQKPPHDYSQALYERYRTIFTEYIEREVREEPRHCPRKPGRAQLAWRKGGRGLRPALPRAPRGDVPAAILSRLACGGGKASAVAAPVGLS